jgi:hypothetical protein
LTENIKGSTGEVAGGATAWSIQNFGNVKEKNKFGVGWGGVGRERAYRMYFSVQIQQKNTQKWEDLFYRFWANTRADKRSRGREIRMKGRWILKLNISCWRSTARTSVAQKTNLEAI